MREKWCSSAAPYLHCVAARTHHCERQPRHAHSLAYYGQLRGYVEAAAAAHCHASSAKFGDVLGNAAAKPTWNFRVLVQLLALVLVAAL